MGSAFGVTIQLLVSVCCPVNWVPFLRGGMSFFAQGDRERQLASVLVRVIAAAARVRKRHRRVSHHLRVREARASPSTTRSNFSAVKIIAGPAHFLSIRGYHIRVWFANPADLT